MQPQLPRGSWPELPRISRQEDTTSERLRRRAELLRALLAAQTNGKAAR